MKVERDLSSENGLPWPAWEVSSCDFGRQREKYAYAAFPGDFPRKPQK
jgi:hypothetical protein